MLRKDVVRKKLVVLLAGDVGLRRTIEKIGEGEQSLRGGVGPGGTVPGALIVGGKAEARAAALGGGGAVLAGESLWIEELLPSMS